MMQYKDMIENEEDGNSLKCIDCECYGIAFGVCNFKGMEDRNPLEKACEHFMERIEDE